MVQLSGEALWSIWYSMANADKIALCEALLERYRSGAISPEGADMLQQLREDAGALMLRRAQALIAIIPYPLSNRCRYQRHEHSFARVGQQIVADVGHRLGYLDALYRVRMRRNSADFDSQVDSQTGK